jgi:L-lactate utilization protein LutC
MSAREEILARLGASHLGTSTPAPSPCDFPTPCPLPTSGEGVLSAFEATARALGIEFADEAPPAVDVSFEAEYFVSTAQLAIAQTGSVVLDATEPRLGSLLPPVHYVIVPRERIVATLEDTFATGIGRNAVIITGPSRTADIEGVLVRGVHGPGRLIFVLR